MDTFITAACKPIFIFHLIVAANFLGTLFGCQTQRLLQENQIIRHSIGFITLYIFALAFGDAEQSKTARLLRLPLTLAVYMMFMLSTKMRFKWWIAFIALLLLANVLQIVHDEVGNTSDTNPDGWTPEQNSAIRITQAVILCIAAVTIVVGFVGYMRDKRQEYKDKFHIIPFILGRPQCKNNGMGDQKSL